VKLELEALKAFQDMFGRFCWQRKAGAGVFGVLSLLLTVVPHAYPIRSLRIDIYLKVTGTSLSTQLKKTFKAEDPVLCDL
jgi:hypothetical protein